MARFNDKHEGDKAAKTVGGEPTKVTVVPGIIYDLTQMIGADCSGIRPAMRQQKGEEVDAYYAMLVKAVRELGNEIKTAKAAW